MAKNNKLKAYVRFDGSGRIVPSSVILQRNKPKVGNWKEIDANECCNPTPSNLCSTFYIIQVVNPETPDALDATSGAAMDSNCNTFFTLVNYWDNPDNPNASVSHQNNVLQKYNESGELLWEKGFDYDLLPETYTYCVSQGSIVDNANNLIVVNYVGGGIIENGNFTGITKFDNNGIELWSILMKTDPLVYTNIQEQYVYDLKMDSSNNIYVLLRIAIDNDLRLNLRKISPLGVILESKSIEVVAPGVSINQGGINVNSNGDVYLIFGLYPGEEGILHIIKLDSSFNEIWSKTIDDPSVQSYLYGVQFDPQENIVINIGNGAGSSLSANERDGSYVKLSPDGDVRWTTKLTNTIDPTYVLGTLQLDTDSSGNIYSSTTYPLIPIPGYTATGYRPLIVSKLSNNGMFEWAYVIDVNNIYNGIDSWYNYIYISGKIVNNTLVLGYYSSSSELGGTTDPFSSQLFKLPLTQLTPGVYGDYIITDITDLWNVSNPVITLTDDTSITYDDVSITVTPLNYIEFPNPTTITKTLLS